MQNLFLVFFTLIATLGNAQKKSLESKVLNVPKKKIVFIIVDGIATDQLKSAATPNLDAIAQNGSYSEAYVGGGTGTYNETPTISAVGYNSLLTGTWANKHNVFGNEIKNPNYNYPSIFRLYKDANPEGTIAVFSSWLDNRTKLVGDGLKQTNTIKVDYNFDGLELDTINYPHDKLRDFMKRIDAAVADKAAKTIKEESPDVSWVYLEYSDDMGHGYGDSPQLEQAITFEDAQIGKIWEAIQEREKATDEDWLLLITTDHGRSEKDGKGHGGQTYRERSTWIVTNEKQTNKYFKSKNPAIVDLLPTMVDFLNMNVPLETKREWDGVSLISPVDAFNLKAQKEGDMLKLTWENLSKTKNKAKILISTTNTFSSGGKDEYSLVKSISLDKQQLTIPLSEFSGKFTKIVLETPHTTLNTWWLAE
tara:strand:- start:14572 stop:15834 length:1263 start_codon:yes stop_codon:yes gene_type:complete